MYKYILEQASNINWMALFALITFFIVFSMSIYLAFMKNKTELDKLSNLPLSDGESISNEEKIK